VFHSQGSRRIAGPEIACRKSLAPRASRSRHERQDVLVLATPTMERAGREKRAARAPEPPFASASPAVRSHSLLGRCRSRQEVRPPPGLIRGVSLPPRREAQIRLDNRSHSGGSFRRDLRTGLTPRPARADLHTAISIDPRRPSGASPSTTLTVPSTPRPASRLTVHYSTSPAFGSSLLGRRLTARPFLTGVDPASNGIKHAGDTAERGRPVEKGLPHLPNLPPLPPPRLLRRKSTARPPVHPLSFPYHPSFPLPRPIAASAQVIHAVPVTPRIQIGIHT